MFDYNQLIEGLQSGVCRVIYTKVDGSTRHAKATLASQFLPEDTLESGGSLLTEGDGDQEVVTYWDLDVDGWRRFRVSAVTSFNVESLV
jgi:hypothetical protein